MGKFDTTPLKTLLRRVSGNKPVLKAYLERIGGEEFSVWRVDNYRHHDIEGELSYQGIDGVKAEVERRIQILKKQSRIREMDEWEDWDIAHALFHWLQEEEDLMNDEGEDIYDMYNHRTTHNGKLEHFMIYNRFEYAICRYDDMNDIHKEEIEDIVEDEGFGHFPEHYVQRNLSGEKVANYFDYTISEEIRNNPEYYLDESDREYSDEQEERMREIDQQIEALENEQQELDIDDAEQEQRYEEIESELDDLRSERDDIENDKEGDWSESAIDQAIEDKKERVKNDPMRYLQDMDYIDDKDFMRQFVDKDEFIKDVFGDDDFGSRFARYDSESNHYDYNGESYIILRMHK